MRKLRLASLLVTVVGVLSIDSFHFPAQTALSKSCCAGLEEDRGSLVDWQIIMRYSDMLDGSTKRARVACAWTIRSSRWGEGIKLISSASIAATIASRISR